MPKSFTSAQKISVDSGFLDLIGGSQAKYDTPHFDSLINSLAYVAQVYTLKLAKQQEIKEVSSSGDLLNKTIALDVKMFGGVYSVEIQTLKYASFLDEGVSGWAKDRGSQFKFKTKGVDPAGPMVASIKQWLIREGKINRITKVAVSHRERRGMKIKDPTLSAAISAAYMIKRQGIAPTHYWRDATKEMDEVIRNEFSAALKIDIIDNIINGN